MDNSPHVGQFISRLQRLGFPYRYDWDRTSVTVFSPGPVHELMRVRFMDIIREGVEASIEKVEAAWEFRKLLQ